MLRRRKWLILLGAMGIVILVSFSGSFGSVRGIFYTATLWLPRMAITGVQAIRLKLGSLNPQAVACRLEEERIDRTVVDIAHLHALEEENRLLRVQAKFLDESGYDSVGARVISRDVHGERALLLVDRGRRDGVEVGQAVVNGDGIFIGKIRVLDERVATIELLSDTQSRVAASLSGQGTLMGVLEGRGNGATVLTYIPANAAIQKDQILMTAGTEDKVPPHLPLGIVNDIEGLATDPFLRASIEPLVTLDRLMFVSILRPSALRPS